MKNYVIDYATILPEFCAQKCSAPSIFGNGNPTQTNPRIVYLCKLLTSLGIEYVMDSWTRSRMEYGVMVDYHIHNIYLMGSSNSIVMAHHDIVNPESDNCNDNSASVINAIAAKILNPSLTVTITDGEEIGGLGSQRVSEKINEGYFGKIDFVLNLELSAVGGQSFFTEYFPDSPLYRKIQSLFPNTPTVNVPFHDGKIVRKNNIDCLVINPLPLEDGKLKMELLNYCHSMKDSIALANYNDMDDFVRNVVTPITNN